MNAKERAEEIQRIAAREHGNDMGDVCRAVAGLIMQVDDLEIELTMVSKAISQSENTERLARIEASIATLRTELQQEREAREEMAEVWRDLWDRRHEP